MTLSNLDPVLGPPVQTSPDWVWVSIVDEGQRGAETDECGVMIDRNAVIGVVARRDDDEVVGCVVEILSTSGPVRVWWSGDTLEGREAYTQMAFACARVCARLGLPMPGKSPE